MSETARKLIELKCEYDKILEETGCIGFGGSWVQMHTEQDLERVAPRSEWTMNVRVHSRFGDIYEHSVVVNDVQFILLTDEPI